MVSNLFKDKNGKVVIVQPPNIPLVAGISLLLAALLRPNLLHNAFARLSFAMLLAWAYLELTQGVNTFRRCLGVIVFIIAIALLILA